MRETTMQASDDGNEVTPCRPGVGSRPEVLELQEDFEGQSAGSTNEWKLGAYTANGGYGFMEAPMGKFAFPAMPAQCQPDPSCDANIGQGPSLMLNNTGPLVGNLTGKTITATFTITGVSPTAAFTYGGEPDGSGAGVTARLYFDSASITKAKTFAETNYWWSYPVNVTLAGNGSFTLTATIDPAAWSDYNGHVGTDPAYPGFTAAASDVKDIGFSFGGGYFFSNGVGTTDGSGTFTQTGFTLS